MKTTYTCEVCWRQFTDGEECHTHEKVCREEHVTGFRLARELQEVLRQAVMAGIAIVTGADNDPLTVEAADYQIGKKQIFISLTD
jgi:hypothetical protein